MARKLKNTSIQPQATVTFVFKGEKAEELATFLFIEWLDGGLDEEFENRMHAAKIGDAIKYDWRDNPYLFEIELDKS